MTWLNVEFLLFNRLVRRQTFRIELEDDHKFKDCFVIPSPKPINVNLHFSKIWKEELELNRTLDGPFPHPSCTHPGDFTDHSIVTHKNYQFHEFLNTKFVLQICIMMNYI